MSLSSSSFSRARLPAGSGPELAAAVTAEALGSAIFQLIAGAARAAASGGSAALAGAPSLVPFVIMAGWYFFPFLFDGEEGKKVRSKNKFLLLIFISL